MSVRPRPGRLPARPPPALRSGEPLPVIPVPWGVRERDFWEYYQRGLDIAEQELSNKRRRNNQQADDVEDPPSPQYEIEEPVDAAVPAAAAAAAAAADPSRDEVINQIAISLNMVNTPGVSTPYLGVIGELYDAGVFTEDGKVILDNFRIDEFKYEENGPKTMIGRIWKYGRLYDDSVFVKFRFNGSVDVGHMYLEIRMRNVSFLRTTLLIFLLMKMKWYSSDRLGVNARLSTYVTGSDVPGDRWSQDLGEFNRRSLTIVTLREMFNVLNQPFDDIMNNPLLSNDATDKWLFSESGETTVVLLSDGVVQLYVDTLPVLQARFGGKMTEDVKWMVNYINDKGIEGNCIVACKNKKDNLCLVYSLIMAMCYEYSIVVRPRSGRSIYTVEEVERAASVYTIQPQIPPYLKRAMEKLIECLIRNDIDRLLDPWMKDRNLYSITEFDSRFRQVLNEIWGMENSTLIPVDVYMCTYKFDSKKQESKMEMFPVSMSKCKDGTRYKIVALNPDSDEVEDPHIHFAAITNISVLYHRCGGKRFYTCLKCKGAFFTHKLLKNHICPEDSDRDSADGYTWANTIWDFSRLPVGNVCPKCHLKFPVPYDDEDEDNELHQFQYDFHMEHCPLRGSTTRSINIEFAEPVPSKRFPGTKGRYLQGNSDEPAVDKYLLAYADFECAIDPEDGQHRFMSYGLYIPGYYDKFEIGYDIEKFLKHLYEAAERNNKEIRVFFHNAMGYDANFILKAVLSNSKKFGSWNVSVIMKSMNKIQRLVFTHEISRYKKIRIYVGDSYLFLLASLERLVADAVKGHSDDELPDKFPCFYGKLPELYDEIDDKDIRKVLRKNLFPYKFFVKPQCLFDKDFEGFCKIFEPREENLVYFGEGVTVEDLRSNHKTFQSVVKNFYISSIRDYHDLYLTCDVLQLADLFNESINAMKITHHIDITDYTGMPGATWAAFLRHDPNLELELYTSTMMETFFRMMMRGGMTSAPMRYAESDATHSLIYGDICGLYAYIMETYEFPTHDLRWRSYDVNAHDRWPINKWLKDNIMDYFLRTEGEGCCLMVDMEMRDKKWRRLTDQYPLAPEHRVISDEFFDANGDLYPFMKEWSEANGNESVKPFVGLVGTLYPKKKYVVHYRVLDWYMRHGMEVTKLYNIVSFKESKILKPYISANVEQRAIAVSMIIRAVLKLANNAIFGKTCENVMKRGEYLVVRDSTTFAGLLNQGRIDAFKHIIDENWLVKTACNKIVLDKPSYIGACITDLAKLRMYHVFYDELVDKVFGADKVKLCYTDTDSLVFLAEHEPGVDAIELLKSRTSVWGNKSGELKDEMEGRRIKRGIFMRAKLYGLEYEDEDEADYIKAKGTTKGAQKHLSFADFERCLMGLENQSLVNHVIERKNLGLTSVDRTKIALNAADGKRMVIHGKPITTSDGKIIDNVHTHAWGWTPEDEEEN